MYKKRTGELPDGAQFISGIYNYCDRWCERCSHTSRCMNYTMGQDGEPGPGELDVTGERFWNKLSETFKLTVEMLRDMAESRGIDLTDVPQGDPETLRRKRVREEARKHACARSALSYAAMVDTWFDSATELFEQRGEELAEHRKFDFLARNPECEIATLRDAVEVIRWYQHILYPKIMRALQGGQEAVPEELRNMPRDADGSAKTALVAIDRSISAWGVLLKQFPDQEDPVLPILVHLERLRRRTEREFPDARSFVRPGFDD